MARMIPDTFEYSRVVSPAEYKIYTALRDRLDDDWMVLHSWRWLKTGKIQQGDQREGEGDFVCFHPACGLIVIEAKGGSIEIRQDGKYYSNGVQIDSPVTQAYTTRFELISRIERLALASRCEVSCCVWFTDVRWHSNIPEPLTEKTLLDERALHDPEAFLRGCIPPFTSIDLDRLSREKIEAILHAPMKAARTLQSRVADALFDIDVRLTHEQSIVADVLSNAPCIGVRGLAGTGKTVIAMTMAVEAAASGARTMFLCFNRALADHVKAQLARDGVDVFTYHEYAYEYLRRHAPALVEGKEPKGAEYFDYIAGELAARIGANLDGYACCFIDEAQDLRPAWFTALRSAFHPAHRFYFFYDALQVPRALSAEVDEEHFAFGAPVSVLTRNLRNPREVALAALNVLGHPYHPLKNFSAVAGDPPEVVLCRNNHADQVRMRMTLWKNTGIAPDQISIISMKGEGHSVVGESVDGEPVRTYRKFKGLENGFIIIVDVGYQHFTETLPRRALYTAITRAKFTAVLIVDEAECEAKTELMTLMHATKMTGDRLKQFINREKVDGVK